VIRQVALLALAAAPWPHFLGPDQDGASRESALAGESWTAPVLAGGSLFVRSTAGELACWDATPPR
jgi:hypothetical protein